ncbi:MAG: LamG-like jellyroll fold domain-containing protein [Bacteroidota bacterium]
MRFILCGFGLLVSSFLLGQDVVEGLVAHYSFDACDNLEKEESGNNAPAVIVGDPSCECGVVGNAIQLDGVDDYLLFLGTISNTFNTIDFSLSMYIKPTNGVGVQNIISKRDDCSVNRAFDISFASGSNFVRAELSQDDMREAPVSAQLDFGRCWYHIVFVRRSSRSQLYIDGQLVQERSADNRVQIDNNGELNIGNGECVGITQNRFAGLIDELRVYNRALRLEEIQTLYLAPDRIQNDDAVVFLGNGVDIELGASCADGFAWFPTNGVADPTMGETTITPTTAGTFNFELDLSDQFCNATDSIQITVIDPEELPCVAQLPKAFTPNGDGRNDTYGISNSIVLEDKLIEFEIFDRWGGRIFTTTSPFNKWDGTFNGKELNPGVLLYRVRYLCGEEEKTDMGSLTLLR